MDKAGNAPLERMGRVRVVLVETTHPGNIGAVARAMKVMGLSRLYLVNPKIFPSAQATARAAGADDLLVNAVICGSLEKALGGCVLVIGATARGRRLEWPVGTPREAAAWTDAATWQGDVAVVFGRENCGLSNAELDTCQRVVRIPTSAGFQSLNIAQAVQICAYEIRLALEDTSASMSKLAPASDPPATAEQLDGLLGHAVDVMQDVGYLAPTRPKLLKRRLRRLFSRSALQHSEVQILRGFLSAIEQRLKRDD